MIQWSTSAKNKTGIKVSMYEEIDWKGLETYLSKFFKLHKKNRSTATHCSLLAGYYRMAEEKEITS